MAKNTKEHILEVSLSLFLRKSFKAVTMKEIVESTGLSKGAFYHYFESKDQLFVEVFKHYYSDILQEDFSAFSHNSLKDFYTHALEHTRKNIEKVLNLSDSKTVGKTNHYLMLFDAIHRNPKFREIVKQKSEQEIKAWEKIIKTAKKTGEINTPIAAKEIAKMFIYMGDGHGMHTFFEKKGERFGARETKKLYDELYELLKK